MSDRPRIVVTLHGPEQAALEEPTWASFDGYLEAIRRAGGEPIALDPTSSAGERRAAFAGMDGLLLPGGADLDPALYGEQPHPAVAVEPVRDDLELEAWSAARSRGVPVFGVCRSMVMLVERRTGVGSMRLTLMEILLKCRGALRRLRKLSKLR